jgi:tetratricopeptide (TPR) repeat protein
MYTETQTPLQLAQLARSRGDRATSLKHFRAALAKSPEQVSFKLELASDLRELGQLEEAEAVLQEVLTQAPHNVSAHIGRGHVARKRGDRAASLASFRAAAAADPNHLGVKLELASDLRELGQLEEAEAVLQEVLTQAPHNVSAHIGRGHVARKRGDRAASLASFRAAAAADPNHLGVKLELAGELKDRGLHQEATSVIDAALRLEPENVHARMQRGYLQRHAGNRKTARDEFRRISETNPGFLQAFVELAIEERALGYPDAAEQILEQVLQRQPDHLPALMQLAEFTRLAGQLEQCLDVYQRAINFHPGSMWLYIHASQALSDCGEHTAAYELLDTAKSLFGERPELICKRTELLKRAGHLNEARHLAEVTLREHPHNFPLWSHCVQFDILLGDFGAAAAKLQAFSSEIVSERSRAHVFRGQLAEALLNYEEAKNHYDAALALNPRDGWARAEMFRVCMLLLNVEEAGRHLEAWTRLNTPAAVARRRSVNVSQSHMGQVYGEFTLNKDLIEQLIQIRALPPENRITPLQSLLRQNADHSASAIQLIVAMRQAKLLNLPRPGGDQQGFASIPKIIVQYWDDPEPPDDVTRLMETWRSVNPDYSRRLFDDAAARAFLTQHYGPEVLRAYRRADNPAEKADLFRLAYLYARGGIYVDADDRCLAPIGSVVPGHVALAVYQEDYALGGLAVGTLGNNFLAAAPNNAVIGRALELATEALNRGDTDIVWLKTGPALITRAFAEMASKTPLKLSSWLKNIAVLERSQLSRFSAIHCFTAYKRTRHWSNTVNRIRAVPPRR